MELIAIGDNGKHSINLNNYKIIDQVIKEAYNLNYDSARELKLKVGDQVYLLESLKDLNDYR